MIVDLQVEEIPAEIRHGDYENDPEFRQQFQVWINRIWQDKDQTVARLMGESAKHITV